MPSRKSPSKAKPRASHHCGIADRLPFAPHQIGHLLDETGRYDEPLDREFPLVIKLFRYTSRLHTRGATWHERLELFLPLDGPARLRMGDDLVELASGDLLVVDNLKLHHVEDFPGFDTRVIVVSFLPEFVYSLGSPSHDYAFLLPFYSKVDKHPHILRANDPLARSVGEALGHLLECYFAREDRQFREAGCKAFLLEILYHLARQFRGSKVRKWEFVRQQERSLRLKGLFDHLSANFAERITLEDAATLAKMSLPQFTRLFKSVAGTTFVAYVTHLRLSHSLRLLQETDRTIAEIADSAGFADQSYFDKRFKKSFGQSPRQFRERQRTAGENRPKT